VLPLFVDQDNTELRSALEVEIAVEHTDNSFVVVDSIAVVVVELDVDHEAELDTVAFQDHSCLFVEAELAAVAVELEFELSVVR
jgi:hypothetical protein